MDDQKTDAPPSATPAQATLHALEEQTTPQMMKRLLQYAQTRAKWVRRAGRPVSTTYARELLDDVRADTMVGDLPWDPSKCNLINHLGQAIRRRTWLEIRNTRQVSLVPLPDAANDEAMPPELEHAFESPPRTACSLAELHMMTATVCQQLRQLLLPHDHAAGAVLKCWEAGVIERDEIMKLTGIDEVAYERARKRLLYTTRNLSSDLRKAAQDLLRSAS